MALLFIDGCEHYTTAGHLQKYDATNSTDQTRHTVGTAYGRFGQGIQYHANGGGGWNQKNIPATDFVVVGQAVRVTATEAGANDPIIALYETGTKHLEVRFTGTGALQVMRNGTNLASGTTIITGGIWYYIELKAVIHATTGSFELRINGVTELTQSGVNTSAGGTSVVNKVHWGLGGNADGGHATQFDDIYVLDDAGTVNNNFLGDVKVETIRPTGPGFQTNFTPSVGANWENVDDAQPDDDSTYNASGTVGHIDTFVLGDLATTAGSVKGIQVINRWRKDDAGARTARRIVRVGTTNYEGADVAMSDSFINTADVLEVNPATVAAWSISDVNALEAGYKVQA